MAFFIPSIQFFFGLPRPLFCFGIHITPIQMDGERVEVCDERVRKAVRGLKIGKSWEQKEFTLKC
jgi:hypothetical protein